MRKSSQASEGAGGMRGVVAASVTPRHAGETATDLGALLEIIDFVCSAGVDGIVLFGSTGEFPLFEADDRERAVSLAVKRSRCPIYVNVSHAALDTAIYLAEQAADAEADGVLIMPPIYFRYDQESIREYMLQFLDAAGRWTPAYLYNIPAFTSGMEADTAIGLLERGFSGIKDSSGSWEYLETLLAAPAARGKCILSGSELLYNRAQPIGAAGVVSGVAACLPELLVAIGRALAQRDAVTADNLLHRVEEFLQWYHQFPAPVAIKEAANVRGLKAGASAAPLGPEKAGALDRFRSWFREWHRGVVRECIAYSAAHKR